MSPRIRRRQPACLVFLILACLFASAAPAAVIHYMEFSQLSFEFPDHEGDVPQSPMGELNLAFDAGPDTEYLNLQASIPGLTIEPGWVVRNFLLHDDTVGYFYEEYSLRLFLDDLGVEPGMLVDTILYGYTLTPEPLLDDDFGAWSFSVPLDQVAPVQQHIEFPRIDGTLIDTSDTDPFASLPSSRYGPFVDPDDSTIAGILGCEMSNVELDSTQAGQENDVNGCVPAACANSMDWMRRTDPRINFPGTLRETYESMSRLMNRNSPHGVWPKDMMRAKLDFIEAHNLPIEVKYQAAYPKATNITSTSGETSATDHGGPYGTFPTEAWLKQEIHDKEDVELNYTRIYTWRDTVRTDGAHCVTVTGTGRSAGADWVHIKHDGNHRTTEAGNLKQVPSAIVTGGDGAMNLPGLGYWKRMPDGTWAFVWPRVDSVISESYKAGGGDTPAQEDLPGYCHFFARTIPPNGALELEFPDDDDTRCYNATIYKLDRTKTPPELVQDRQWNLNKGKGRAWVNEGDEPVTVYVHNDDPSPGGMQVNVHVAPVVTGVVPDPGNAIIYAGFSCGGTDASDWEFNQDPMPAFVSVQIGNGTSMSDIPNRLAEFGNTSQLHLMREIHPNPYWEVMGLVIDVLTVNAPGDILVDCPATGHVAPMTITGPGRYEMTLGDAMGAPMFEIFLTATNGLDIVFDSIGIPSLVQADYTDAPPAAPTGLELRAAPNPFNPSVTFTFRLPAAGDAELSIFDLRGRRVAVLVDGPVGDVERTATWHGRDEAGREVPAGTYVARLSANGLAREERVTLVK